MQNSLYKLFEHICMLEVCTLPSYNEMSPIERLRCSDVGCNNEYSSRHLLPTSEPLKTQRINVTLVFEGNAPIPDLHKYA